MVMTELDYEEVATQRLAWRAELATLKQRVARAEAETRAEFNVLLATVSAEQPESCERLAPQYVAAARQVEVQLQDWGLILRELKVTAVQAEAAATEAYDALLVAALVSSAVGGDRRQAAWAASTTRVVCRREERSVDIATLRAKAARAATQIKDAYSALLTALQTSSGMAREKRRTLFSLPTYE
jgi:hypothetical protein